MRAWIGECVRCGLCHSRKQIVVGWGAENARLLFVGEAPGAEEDSQGLPFVGPAGQLLTKIVEAMGWPRDGVYVANVVQCKPPQGRPPAPEEIETCLPFLKAQIELIAPAIIVALGVTAARALTGEAASLGSLRGKFYPLPWARNIPVMATYHPDYLLRNPDAKRDVWQDMKQVAARLAVTDVNGG